MKNYNQFRIYCKMKLKLLILALILILSQSCMVKVLPPNVYYCDAVTYPCLTGICVTIPLQSGMVQCQCKTQET
jgi:hypothetical protein